MAQTGGLCWGTQRSPQAGGYSQCLGFPTGGPYVEGVSVRGPQRWAAAWGSLKASFGHSRALGHACIGSFQTSVSLFSAFGDNFSARTWLFRGAVQQGTFGWYCLLEFPLSTKSMLVYPNYCHSLFLLFLSLLPETPHGSSGVFCLLEGQVWLQPKLPQRLGKEWLRVNYVSSAERF